MIGTGAPLRWPNRDPPTGDFRVYPNVRTLYHHLACGRGQGFVRLRRTAQFPPRYNVALTQPIPIVRLVDGARWYALVRRGFLPAWVRHPKTFSTNRRFATPCGGGAALFPPTASMNGTPARRSARPYFVRPKSGGAITFAGLWETWTGPNGEEVDTAAIVTTRANRARCHTRPHAGHRRTGRIQPLARLREDRRSRKISYRCFSMR